MRIKNRIFSIMLASIMFVSALFVGNLYVAHAAEMSLYNQDFTGITDIANVTDWSLSADVNTDAKASSWSIADGQLTATVTRITGPGQASAALNTEEALNWSDYSFSTDVTVDKSSANTYATLGMRAYAQANTTSGQEKECYEYRVTLLNSGNYTLELYKMFKNDAGNRVAQKVTNTTYTPTDLTHKGAATVTYNAKIEVSDGTIKCYINDVCVLEYSTASEENDGYKAPYGSGTIGIFVSTYGGTATTNTVKFDNIVVAEAIADGEEEEPDTPQEPEERACNVAGDENFRVVLVDDFSTDKET